ncbi:hypothetical protein [Stakelama tenebrarum]|uniref:Uncharacterized protein n=1 Tax=Stakelama tenebrarum TaxID=2711215 RepID=A0A6G6Y257_9SPHN|nr:hypothetical protein [Sphingosinithalassobacter tenebrarum]QIG78921.1 hypothetical protein G5C33_03380 [Sphingosinithalassobacter tenebrarum]
MMSDAEYEEEIHGGGVPAPVLGILVGLALIVVVALIAPQILPPLPQAYLFGGGAVLGLVVWAIAAAVTMRSAGALWIVASLVLLVGGGVLGSLNIARLHNAGGTHDASTFAEIEVGPDGRPQLPPEADKRGPISQAYVEAFNAARDDRQALDDAMAEMNLGALNSPYLLEQTPEILGRCEEIAAIKERADTNSERRAERTGALAEMVASSELPEKIQQGITMMIAPVGKPGEPDPALEQQQALLDGTQQLCELLAKRSWRNEAAYFGFTNGADRRRFEEINEARQAAAKDIAALERQATTRLTEGREMVREALSR